MSENAMNEYKAKFQRLLELREVRDREKKQSKKSEAAYREAEAELYAELEEAGIRGRLEFDFGGDLGVAKFQRRSTTYGRVLNKAELIAALKKEGLNDVIVAESIAEGRFNELVRDRMENKQTLPEGGDFYTRDGISISRK